MDKPSILTRIKRAYEIKSETDLASFLGVSKSTLSNWYSRNSIDYDLVFSKCELLNFHWLITGDGNMFKSDVTASEKNQNFPTDIKDVIDLATQLGMQIKENEQLHRENMKLLAENERLKKELENKKNNRPYSLVAEP